MIIADQPSPQFDEVVDLAVEDHRVAFRVLRWSPTQWLAGALNVDDAESVESQRDPVVVPDGSVVGAAVPRAGHAFGDLLDLLVQLDLLVLQELLVLLDLLVLQVLLVQ